MTGAFGFFNENLFCYTVFGVGLGCAIMYASYGYGIKYVSPIALCTAFLFEPFISQTVACMLGLDKLPGIMTFIGTMVVLLGLYYVAIGG